MRDGLTELKTFAENLDSNSLLNTTIPLFNKSVADVINLQEIVERFVDPILDYLNDTNATHTVEELLKIAIENASDVGGGLMSSILTGGVVIGGNELVFDFSLQFDKTLSLPLDLGSNAFGVGFGADATANVDIGATFNLAFGVDLSSGLTTAQRLFMSPAKSGSPSTPATSTSGSTSARYRPRW